MKVQNRLGELVARKERLEGRRYSYRDIAKETGLSINTVKSWYKNEASRFDEPVILALCEWLNISVGELLIIEPPIKDDSSGNLSPLGDAMNSTSPIPQGLPMS